jgi:hypothetical protein
MMPARRNVLRVVERMREQSRVLDVLVRERRIACRLRSWVDHGYDEDGLVGSLIVT